MAQVDPSSLPPRRRGLFNADDDEFSISILEYGLVRFTLYLVGGGGGGRACALNNNLESVLLLFT